MLRTFPRPIGTEHPDWPEWAKAPHPSGRARILGCIEYIGDEPFSDQSPRQIEAYRDFPISQDDIRLKSDSIRKAIGTYVAGPVFEQWVGEFVRNLTLPAHQRAVGKSINNILQQFNLARPNMSAPDEVTRAYMEGNDPNMARMILNYSQMRFKALLHPELVLALALYQGAYIPYLGQLEAALSYSPVISVEEKQNAYTVLDGPLSTFKSFVIFGTFLELALLQREEISRKAGAASGEPELTVAAISQAWEVFTHKKLLRRNFSNGMRMICPANQHLRYIRESRIVERLFEFIWERRESPLIADLTEAAYQTTHKAVCYPVHYYWRFRAEAIANSRQARGGQGLTVPRPPKS